MSRKRSAQELETDVKLADGLSHLWNEYFSTCFDRLREVHEVHSPIKYRLRPKEPTTSHLNSSSTLKSLEEICEKETSRQARAKRSRTYIPESAKYPFKSRLQQQLLDKPKWTQAMRRYFRAVSILEHEHDHGILKEEPYAISMTKGSLWTPAEKKQFFIALDRCGQNNIPDITRRIGPTKTMAEVQNYLNTLKLASQGLEKVKPPQPFAREMSNTFMVQEAHLAEKIQQALEVESYEKHLALSAQPEIEQMNQLFELWNMSSLTRLFGGTGNMHILSSTTFNLHVLLKQFIKDLLVDLYTQLLDDEDKTVTKSLVNFVVAKREKLGDPRLKYPDVASTIDGLYTYRSLFSKNRSISFLAKKRKMKNADDEEEEDTLQEPVEREEGMFFVPDLDSSDEEIQWDGENSEEDESITSEATSELSEVDDTDELKDRFVTEDLEIEHRIALHDTRSSEIEEGHDFTVVDTKEAEDTDNEEQEEEDDVKSIELKEEYESDNTDDHQDELDELEMKEQDAIDELELTKYLEFYTKEQILAACT